VLTGNFFLGESFNVMARINYFGKHYDERGTIAGECGDVLDLGDGDEWVTAPCGSAGDAWGPVNMSREIDATYYLDLELGWRLNDNWRFVLGGSNVLDEFIETIERERIEGSPSQVPDVTANRIGVGLQYPRRTVANYEGASYYLRGEFSW
jgi:iron complex outermembrane receptor protein